MHHSKTTSLKPASATMPSWRGVAVLFVLIIIYLSAVCLAIYSSRKLEDHVSSVELQRFVLKASPAQIDQLKQIAKDRAILHKDLKELDEIVYSKLMQAQQNKILNPELTR